MSDPVVPEAVAPVHIERAGPVRRISAPDGISHHGGLLVVADELWLTANAYRAGSYATSYVALSDAGDRVVVEDQGVLPTLFAGPDEAAWAIVTNPYGPRDREVVRRVGGPLVGTPHPPFVGEPSWLDGDQLVLVNASDKGDRWMRYDTRSGARKLVKLPPPSRASYLRNEEGIHSLAGRTHRLLDPTGAILRERTLELGPWMVRVSDLRFDGDSILIAANRETMWWVVISPDGTLARTELLAGSFFNLWPVVPFGDGSIGVRYNGDRGNGWVLARGGVTTEAASSDPHGYVERDGRRIVELPAATWILSGLACVAGRPTVVVYPQHPSRRAEALWVVTSTS